MLDKKNASDTGYINNNADDKNTYIKVNFSTFNIANANINANRNNKSVINKKVGNNTNNLSIN